MVTALRGAADRLALALLALSVWGSPTNAARSPMSREYDLKAAFLFNFAQFVDWPSSAFPDSKAPITIAILGEDPFGSSLDEIVSNETAHDRPIVVRRFHSVDDIADCQILFVSPSLGADWERVAAKLDRRSILTVGETKDFAVHSGIVGFELKQRRLRLRINLEAATARGLVISSKLMRQVEVVGPRHRAVAIPAGVAR